MLLSGVTFPLPHIYGPKICKALTTSFQRKGLFNMLIIEAMVVI